MTPQERQLIDSLFDRLATLEGEPRDAQAMAAIADGLRRAPSAAYALVQTVLLQDEALSRANERIEELERETAAAAPAAGGFLDPMRGTLFGQGQPRGSVPPSGVAAGERPAWNSGAVLDRMQQPPMQPDARPAGGGGSFLGTAAAAAAGAVGGSLLMNSIRGLMGGGGEKGQSLAANPAGGTGPWGGSSGSDAGKGDLARDAGVNDIGSGGSGDQRMTDSGDDRSADDRSGGDGRFDQAGYDDESGYDDDDDGHEDFDDDFDDGDFDDSDFA